MVPTDSLRSGALAVAGAGVAWAGLCVLLAAGGHGPSVSLLPIGREHYYLAQAAFVVPVLLAQWLLCAGVAHGLARRLGGRGRFGPTAGGLGWALAAPLVLLFLLPDLVVYALAGFEALGALVRVTAPLSLLATLALATRAVRRAHGISPARALGAAAAGVLVQAALGGLLLR